ncbi:hypothetical protein DPEC_G00375150 [Dallia pectoralis]|nr:hypothetical protein DPEC_G00375150 [Dallia pectoralis]
MWAYIGMTLHLTQKGLGRLKDGSMTADCAAVEQANSMDRKTNPGIKSCHNSASIRTCQLSTAAAGPANG